MERGDKTRLFLATFHVPLVPLRVLWPRSGTLHILTAFSGLESINILLKF